MRPISSTAWYLNLFAIANLGILARMLGVDRIRISRDRIYVHRPGVGDVPPLVLSAGDVGHSSVQGLGQLWFSHGPPEPGTTDKFRMRFGSRWSSVRGEILNRLASMATGFVASIDDGATYTRGWTVADVLPSLPHITTIRLTTVRGDGPLVETLSGPMRMWNYGGHSLTWLGPGGGRFLYLGADTFYLHNGMTLGAIVPKSKRSRMRLGSGEEFALADGVIERDGKVIGEVVEEAGSARFDFREPEPELLGALLTLLYAATRFPEDALG